MESSVGRYSPTCSISAYYRLKRKYGRHRVRNEIASFDPVSETAIEMKWLDDTERS